jgi:hypothetical protein
MINTYMIKHTQTTKTSSIRFYLDVAPEYFSRWRLFPRAFVSMYIYLLYDVVQWFMLLPEPNTSQAGLVSVLVGAGAAWFGLYVNSVPSHVSTKSVAEVTTKEDKK